MLLLKKVIKRIADSIGAVNHNTLRKFPFAAYGGNIDVTRGAQSYRWGLSVAQALINRAWINILIDPQKYSHEYSHRNTKIFL